MYVDALNVGKGKCMVSTWIRAHKWLIGLGPFVDLFCFITW